VNPSDVAAPLPEDSDPPAARAGSTSRTAAPPRGRTAAPKSGVAKATTRPPARQTGRTPERSRFEARKVRRLIRHIDPWSVFKLSLLLFVCIWLIFMIAGVIVWAVARGSGSLGKIESFVNSNLGADNWKLNGEFIFRQYGLLGLVISLALTAASTIAAVIFNLISDIIGGVWVTVIEEETTRSVSS